MKHRIAPDLDALMWKIAEDFDLPAAEDFQSRFPELKGELATRMSMVRGLRQSRPEAKATEVVVPRFVPREPTVVNRRAQFVVVGMATLAVLAFGSYVVVANLPKNAPKPAMISVAPDHPTVGSPNSTQPETMNETPVKGTEPEPETSKPRPVDPVVMPWDKPQSVAIADAPLIDVLNMIGMTCKLQLEIAPKMPNPTISVQYSNKTGMDMLKDLGNQYGFTPLAQGDGRVLIVPAVPFTNPG